SSRRRRKTGARRWPSSVHDWNLTSATSFGCTQVVGFGRSGFSSNGQVLRSSGSRLAFTWATERSSKPDPTCDAKRSFFLSQYPTRIAPSDARDPLPRVQPPTTNSALRVGLTFSQAPERRPDS